jgi:hypothetical protein
MTAMGGKRKWPDYQVFQGVGMGWIIELAVDAIAQMFGMTVGKDRPWWVELAATLGCLAVIGVIAALIWFLFVL